MSRSCHSGSSDFAWIFNHQRCKTIDIIRDAWQGSVKKCENAVLIAINAFNTDAAARICIPAYFVRMTENYSYMVLEYVQQGSVLGPALLYDGLLKTPMPVK